MIPYFEIRKGRRISGFSMQLQLICEISVTPAWSIRVVSDAEPLSSPNCHLRNPRFKNISLSLPTDLTKQKSEFAGFS